MWIDTPRGRIYVASGTDWEGLIRSAFVEPLKGR